MKLSEMFPEGGRGILGTADAAGVVNMAVFAVPHVIDEETLAWGFTDGRSLHNLMANPHATYLYMAPGGDYSGWRVTMSMKEEKEEGALLKDIRGEAASASIPAASGAIKAVVFFKVDEVRPLI